MHISPLFAVRFPVLMTLLAAALLAGCSSGVAISSSGWQDDTQRGARYDKVLVVAMAADGDKRLSFEDELASKLRGEGTDVWPSSRSMDASLPISNETVIPVAAATGAQVVLVTRVTDMAVQSVERSAPYTDVSARRREGTVFQYDYIEKELPALVTADFSVELTTDVLNAADGTVLYTVVSSAVGQESLSDVIKVSSDVISKRLRRDGVIR